MRIPLPYDYGPLLIDSSWSNAAYVLNEIHNPVRTLKIAAPTGLGICGVLYLLANVSYYAAATPEEVSNSGTTVASYFMGKVFGSAAERALRYDIPYSCFNSPTDNLFIIASSSQYPPSATS